MVFSRWMNNRKPIELSVRAHKVYAARSYNRSLLAYTQIHSHHCKLKHTHTHIWKIHLFYDRVIWFGYCWLLVTQRNCSLRQLFFCARTSKRTTDIWGSSRISAHFPFRFARWNVLFSRWNKRGIQNGFQRNANGKERTGANKSPWAKSRARWAGWEGLVGYYHY